MKTTVNQRFEIMINSLAFTKNAFAKTIGVASTQIYNIINGRNAPSYDLLQRIALKFPTVNLTWLLTGNGQPLIGTVDSSDEGGLTALQKVKNVEDQLQVLSKKLEKKEDLVVEKITASVIKKLTAGFKG